MIKCCIFDLDGTILDTIHSITHFVNITFQKHGIEPIDVEECKYFAGYGARELIRRSLESKGIIDAEVLDLVLSDYLKTYNDDPLYLTRPFDGIVDVLRGMKERGIRLAVHSNKPDTTVKSVVEGFFPGVFEIAVGGREGVPLKPDPAAAQEILKELGVSPSETAWVGDTSTDIETGKNLGAALSVGVLWGFRKRDELCAAGADAIVDDAASLLREVVEFA